MTSSKPLLLLIYSTLASGCLHLTLHHQAPTMRPAPDYPPLAVLRIDPSVEWTETALTVRTGDRLIIRSEGEIRWTTADRRVNPDGRGWSSFGVGNGGLIARVGSDKPFDVGARTHLFPDMHARPPHIPFVPPSLTIKRDGKLFLSFKAWEPCKFNGAFTVTIWRDQP